MTQIVFYRTAPLKLEKTLISLLEKSYEGNHNSLILFENKENCSKINELLWTYDEETFLAHTFEDDTICNSIKIPIHLSTKFDSEYKANLLFLVDGFIPGEIKFFERVIIIIDVNDNILMQKYKNYYHEIKSNYKDIVFYKFTDNGKWIKENFMR